MSASTDIDVIICAECGSQETISLDSVNLTPDVVLVELSEFPVSLPFVELDIAFDWCNTACFGRWLFRAAAHMQAVSRP